MRIKVFICMSVIVFAYSHLNTCIFQNQAGEIMPVSEMIEMIQNADQTNSEGLSDLFDIQNAWVEEYEGKKWMHIEVIQSKGCDKNYSDLFEMNWDGIILMIYPPQVGLHLKLNTEICTELMENVSGTLVFDLYDLIGDEKLIQTAVFKVFNTSKKAGENEFVVSG